MNEIKTKRNTGIELFRSVAMMLVIVLHILGQGGVLAYSAGYKSTYYAAWFLEALAYCAVDCYALISGFVNSDETFRLRRIVKLWLEAVFFVGVTTLYFYITGAHNVTVTHENWCQVYLPVSTKDYWYLNAYILLSVFIPILNKGLKNIEKRTYQYMLCVLFVLTTVLHTLVGYDTFVTSSGYSAIWLIVLYVFGAYFRIHGIPKFANKYLMLAVGVLSGVCAWGIKIHYFELIEKNVISKDSEYADRLGRFVQYTSPFVLVMAICLLLFFAQINIKHKIPSKIVCLLGKASFGVYLLHLAPLVWDNVVSYKFIDYAHFGPFKLIYMTVLTAIIWYLIMSVISLVRMLLFKVCGINGLVDFLGDKLTELSGKIFKRT